MDSYFEYESLEIRPLDILNSNRFFTFSINRYLGDNSLEILKKCKGIPLIIEVFSMIYKYGGIEILDKVNMKHVSQFTQQEESSENLSVDIEINDEES